MFGDDNLFERLVESCEPVENDENKNVDEQEEVKEDTGPPKEVLQELLDAWELIGSMDDDPHVRTMADEKAEELHHALTVGQSPTGEGELGYKGGGPFNAPKERGGIRRREAKTNEETKIKENSRSIVGAIVDAFYSIIGLKVDIDELSDYVDHLNTDDYNALEDAVSRGDKDEIVQIMKSVGFTESKTDEEEVKTFVCDGCGKTLPLSDLSLSKGNKNYCPRCRGKANDENTGTVSNDSAFEQTIDSFAKIENDQNKNVDEQDGIKEEEVNKSFRVWYKDPSQARLVQMKHEFRALTSQDAEKAARKLLDKEVPGNEFEIAKSELMEESKTNEQEEVKEEEVNEDTRKDVEDLFGRDGWRLKDEQPSATGVHYEFEKAGAIVKVFVEFETPQPDPIDRE